MCCDNAQDGDLQNSAAVCRCIVFLCRRSTLMKLGQTTIAARSTFTFYREANNQVIVRKYLWTRCTLRIEQGNVHGRQGDLEREGIKAQHARDMGFGAGY
jgi:hypothetical protein